MVICVAKYGDRARTVSFYTCSLPEISTNVRTFFKAFPSCHTGEFPIMIFLLLWSTDEKDIVLFFKIMQRNLGAKIKNVHKNFNLFVS